MTGPLARRVALLSALVATSTGAAAAPTWQPVEYQGEAALQSVVQDTRAIVSLARARLVFFGAARSDTNLLLASPASANPNLRGGHRVWLGPQSAWKKSWPPPAAWENQPAVAHEERNGRLIVRLADAGDGWPSLARTYRWEGDRLVCGAEISGGTRAAQVIQILQIPPDAVVRAGAVADDDHPAGYVILPSIAGPFAARFPPPPHLAREGDALAFRHLPAVVKLGFRPQVLRATAGHVVLTLARGAGTETAAGSPDDGFFTQLYLGGREPLIELEQLSPLFPAGTAATFEVVLGMERAIAP